MSRWFFLLLPGFLASFPAFAAPQKPVRYSAEQLIGLMDDAELDYYHQVFDYTMQNEKPGQPFTWKTYASHGIITPDQPFAGKGTVCRNFQEVLTVKNQYQAAFNGTACKRMGADGWCKLRRNDVETCALEPPRTFLGRLGQSTDDTIHNVTNKAASWWPF